MSCYVHNSFTTTDLPTPTLYIAQRFNPVSLKMSQFHMELLCLNSIKVFVASLKSCSSSSLLQKNISSTLSAFSSPLSHTFPTNFLTLSLFLCLPFSSRQLNLNGTGLCRNLQVQKGLETETNITFSRKPLSSSKGRGGEAEHLKMSPHCSHARSFEAKVP